MGRFFSSPGYDMLSKPRCEDQAIVGVLWIPVVRTFDIVLSHEDRCGAELHIDHGQIKGFAIRYDGCIDGAWHNIAIFDAHGGVAHWHLVDPIKGKGEQQRIELDLKGAVACAFGAIKTRWEEWREWYIGRLRRDDQQDFFR